MSKITLSRAVLEALVDPQGYEYVDGEFGTCNFCRCDCTVDTRAHADSCPVRLAQEALATGFTITDCVFTRIRRPDDPEI